MEGGTVEPMICSLLVSCVLSEIPLAVLAFALYRLHLREGQVNLVVHAVYFIACLTGGFVAGKGVRQHRFFWRLLAGLFYLVVLFAVSWVMSVGSLIDMERSVAATGVCTPGGIIGGMVN